MPRRVGGKKFALTAIYEYGRGMALDERGGVFIPCPSHFESMIQLLDA
jgi:hypothetical protein